MAAQTVPQGPLSGCCGKVIMLLLLLLMLLMILLMLLVMLMYVVAAPFDFAAFVAFADSPAIVVVVAFGVVAADVFCCC